MSRIDEVFLKLKKEKGKALIPFVVGGYPSLEACERLILGLDQNGADLIEIGIPYSDPLADGPTIQKAYEVALSGGVNLDDILNMAERLKGKIDAPIILMTYYNVVLTFGEEHFATQAAAAGVSGVIIPDLPVEEASAWIDVSKKSGLDTIFLASPTSSEDRLKLISKASSGFIYALSLTGVTGARRDLSSDLGSFLSRLKEATRKPVAVGFGISSPDNAKEAASFSDGVIVGSALVDLIDHSGIEYDKIYGFIKAMKAAIGG